MICMGGPGVHPRPRTLHIQCARLHGADHTLQPALERGDVRFRQGAFAAGIEHIAEKFSGLACRRHEGFARMQFQTAAFEEARNFLAPMFQNRWIIMEQREVIDVAQLRGTQDFGAEMIQRIEIDIGAELAGELADRQAAAAIKRRE